MMSSSSINSGVDVEFSQLEEFEFWLEELEDKLILSTQKRPRTKDEANTLINLSKKLKNECLKKELPEELKDRPPKKERKAKRSVEEGGEEEDEDDYDYDDDEEEEELEISPKAEELKARFNILLASLDDNLTKARDLINCWDKLREDMDKLTKAISSGGSGNKLTMAKLEASIAQIKRTFKQRAAIIEEIAPHATGGAA